MQSEIEICFNMISFYQLQIQITQITKMLKWHFVRNKKKKKNSFAEIYRVLIRKD